MDGNLRKFRAITDFGVLICITIALVGASNGIPLGESSVPSSAVVADPTTGTTGNAVVPQVGYLEDRPDVKVQNDQASSSNGDAGKGILVPIVSVVNPQDSTAKNANPLVALLPAPASAGAGSPADPAKLPVVATLPIVPAVDPPSAVHPEIRRSLDDLSSGTKIRTNLRKNEDSTFETMDVAEDIVFRPLFRIRQNPGGNYPTYTRRRNGSNDYRRYNVNGYYRLPYNSFRNNNYGDDRSSYEY